MFQTLKSLTRTASEQREAAALQRATDAELAANAIARHAGQLHDALQEMVDSLPQGVVLYSDDQRAGVQRYHDAVTQARAVLDQADRWSQRG